MKRCLHIVTLFITLWGGKCISQTEGIKISAFLDTAKIRIGEQVKLDLYVQLNPNERLSIQWPEIGDTITEKIEVISVSLIDTTLPDKNNTAFMQQHQQLILSVYDSGFYVIPPFKFILNGDTANPRYSEALLLEVHTVPTDTSLAKTKDIREPFNEPFNWRWYKSYIYLFIAGILTAAIIFGIIHYINKKRRNKIIEASKPKIPAHITALASLDKIKQEQLWKEGKYKVYYSEIADTIRLYIEERFDVHALESTTDEILMVMRSRVVDPVSMEKMRQILVLSDFVKFAKMIPIEQEHELTLRNAFDFVNGTKREEEYKVTDLNTDQQNSQT